MILQALYDYYQRKQNDPDASRHLPRFGFEDKEIPFIIELDAEGRLLGLKDTRRLEGKKRIASTYLVPQGIKKTSGVAANLLWDTAEYVLGIDTKGKPERAAQQHAAFRERIMALPAQDDAGVQAVLAFLAANPIGTLEKLHEWPEILETNPIMSFRLHPDKDLVCQRPGVADVPIETETAEQAICLVTGEPAAPERLHSAIKGVWGAQTSGANIVSFNLDAFRSFGKEQGANAPVGEAAAFAYTTALNHLLAKGSRQRMQVGDASTVFWSQKEDALEDDLVLIFGDADDPDARIDAIRSIYEAVHSGKYVLDAGDPKFFVLGLAPNAARISIRFWHVAPLSEIAHRITQWFDDLKLHGGPNDPEFPSLFRLLTAIAVQHKADNVPPRLGGDIMRAILDGSRFPATWLNLAVQRCRAEQQVSHLRAAAIKANLNRLARTPHPDTPSQDEEYLPVLDISNPNTAYRLGRLFATLERIQEAANPGLNATIRDRYYGAASSTPVAVFTTLLRLKNAHLKKLPTARVVVFEKLLGEILGEIEDFPKHLALPDQGRFALGYYHQRQSFYTKAAPTEFNESTETTEEIH